jgi:hypothetical protein
MRWCIASWIILGIIFMSIMILNIDDKEISFQCMVIGLLFGGFGLTWYFMKEKP